MLLESFREGLIKDVVKYHTQEQIHSSIRYALSCILVPASIYMDQSSSPTEFDDVVWTNGNTLFPKYYLRCLNAHVVRDSA